MVRWLVLSLLVLKLGPGAVDIVAHHALPVLLIVLALAVVGFGVWWRRRKRGGLESDEGSGSDEHEEPKPR